MIEMSGYGSSQLRFICTSGWSEVHTSLALYHWVEDKEQKPCCYSTLASAILWGGGHADSAWVDLQTCTADMAKMISASAVHLCGV